MMRKSWRTQGFVQLLLAIENTILKNLLCIRKVSENVLYRIFYSLVFDKGITFNRYVLPKTVADKK